MEIAVSRPGFHRVDRAHAAVGLELTPVVDNRLPGRFVRTGEHRPAHHAVAACRQRFHHIARVAQTAVGDDRHARALDSLRGLEDSRQLRHAHTRNDTRGADRARTDTHFHTVSTVLHKILRSLSGSDIPHYDIQFRIFRLYRPQCIHNVLRVSVRRVEHDSVHTLFVERVHAVHIVCRDTHARSAAQATFRVLASIGEVFQFGDIFVGNQPREVSFFVHHGQFLHFVGLQRVHNRRVVRGRDGNQVLARHHLGYRTLHVRLKTQVAVRYNPHQHVLVVHHGNTADVVFLHQLQRIAHGLLCRNSDRVGNQSVLRTLHAAHLSRLRLDRHVLVNHTDTAFAGDSNRHRRLRHGVHRCRHHGDVQANVTGELTAEVHLTRKHLRISGHQQHIVKGKPLFNNSIRHIEI